LGLSNFLGISLPIVCLPLVYWFSWWLLLCFTSFCLSCRLFLLLEKLLFLLLLRLFILIF